MSPVDADPERSGSPPPAGPPEDPAVGARRFLAPSCAVLLLFLAGMAVAGTGHWRRGAFVMGAAALAGGIIRWVLPQQWAGMLSVRRRWFDVLLMLGAGVVIWLVALVVPPQ